MRSSIEFSFLVLSKKILKMEIHVFLYDYLHMHILDFNRS